VGKYAESLLTLGWAAEFALIPIAVNSLWPATTIASTGMLVAMGEDIVLAQARNTQIMADAVHALVTRPAADCSGHFYTDEELLREEGWDDDDLSESSDTRSASSTPRCDRVALSVRSRTRRSTDTRPTRRRTSNGSTPSSTK
jgi:hypothetical protein